MLLDRTYRNYDYRITAMQPQVVDTAILQILLDKFVELGLIDELARFQIYSDAAEAVSNLPGDNIEIAAELIMLADSQIGENGELKCNNDNGTSIFDDGAASAN